MNVFAKRRFLSDHAGMRALEGHGRRAVANTQLVLVAFLVASLAVPARTWAAPPSVLVPTTLGAGGPTITVMCVSLDAKASAQQGAIEGAAEEALQRASRFTVLFNHEALNPNATKKRNAALEDAATKLKEGKTLIDELENVKATESFTSAVELLQQNGDLSRDFPALLDAWTMKAAGHATGGEMVPAKKDIESVIGLNVKAEFSPTFFPPDLIKFTEATRKIASNAKGELLVRTEPAGARVWVDGTFRGISPVTVAGLTASKHFVTARLGGYALGQTQASPGEEVISLAGAELAPGWKKAITDIKKDPEGEGRDLAAQQLAKAAQLDQVLLVIAKKSLAGEKLDLIALRLEARDQHNAAYKAATVSSTDPEALAGFFDSLTGRDAKRDGKNPVHHFKGGGGAPIQTIAGIGLLAGAGAFLINGIVFGVIAGNNQAAFVGTPQTSRFVSEQLAKEGRTYSLIADFSYLFGLAAGVTGGLLLLLNKGGGGAEDPQAEKDDARRKEVDRRAAEERRASEERAKEDERRREEEKKREEERRNQKPGDDDAKKAEEEEAKKKADEEEAKKKADEEAAANKKLSKKEQRELEKKKKEEERQAKKEEEKRKKEEEKQRKEDEKRAAEEKKKQEAEEKANNGKLSRKQKEEEERKKKEEEEAAAAKAKAEAEERARKEEEERKKKEEEERKKKEAEKKKKDEDHDDLRNY